MAAKRHLAKKTDCCSCAAMRGAMDGDVAAERQLNFVERLLARMPGNRGFRVHADGTRKRQRLPRTRGALACTAPCCKAEELARPV